MNGDSSRLMKGIVIFGLVIEVAVILWLFQMGDGADQGGGRGGIESRGGIPSSNEPRGCGGRKPPSPSSGVLVDDGERIAIEIPEEWDGQVSGSLVTLEKNNGRATISAGLGPSGGLASALADLGSSLRRSYESMRLHDRVRLEVDGCPARSIAGEAVNQEGADLRFEALVVAGSEGNFAIAGFLERGSERGLATEVRRMIRSIQLLAPSSIS